MKRMLPLTMQFMIVEALAVHQQFGYTGTSEQSGLPRRFIFPSKAACRKRNLVSHCGICVVESRQLLLENGSTVGCECHAGCVMGSQDPLFILTREYFAIFRAVWRVGFAHRSRTQKSIYRWPQSYP